MKRLLFILLLLPSLAWGEDYARMNPYILGGGASAAALTCSGATVQQSETDDTGNSSFARYTNNDWKATEVTYGGTTGTLCRIDAKIACATNDCTQIVTAHLYSDNGSDSPNTSLGSCTGTYDTTPLTTTYEFISFTGCNISISNGTKYWVVLTVNAVDSTHYLLWRTDGTCETEKVMYSADGASWTEDATTYCNQYRLYILE